MQGYKLELQEKEEMDKVKYIALTETAVIKSEVQSMIALVKNMDKEQIRPIKSFKSEFKRMKRGMIYAPRLERWSEDMESAIIPVLQLLY